MAENRALIVYVQAYGNEVACDMVVLDKSAMTDEDRTKWNLFLKLHGKNGPDVEEMQESLEHYELIGWMGFEACVRAPVKNWKSYKGPEQAACFSSANYGKQPFPVSEIYYLEGCSEF